MPVLARALIVAALAALAGCGGGDASAVPASGIQAAAGTSPDPAAIDDAETVITSASAVLL
jgi:hypothetical protein